MGWMANATLWALYRRERKSVLILQEAGWAPGSVWKDVKKRKSLASTGIRTSNCPACSESLYRLSYPIPLNTIVTTVSGNLYTFVPTILHVTEKSFIFETVTSTSGYCMREEREKNKLFILYSRRELELLSAF